MTTPGKQLRCSYAVIAALALAVTASALATVPTARAAHAAKATVTVMVNLTIGQQSVSVNGVTLTTDSGRARFGTEPRLQRALATVRGLACRYAGEDGTTGEGYDLYDTPYTVAITFRSALPQHSCSSNVASTAATTVAAEGPGVVVETNLGDLRVGEPWNQVPVRLRSAATWIEGFLELPIQNPCYPQSALLDQESWRISVGINYPGFTPTRHVGRSPISDVVVMVGGVNGVPSSGPVC